MRTWAVSAFAIGLASACSGDPTLSVAVTHPKKYMVQQTIVTAYNGQMLSCDQIMLGDRTAAELAAFTTDEVDASSGGTILVPRLGDKAIVARGYTASQQLATAGCKDVGDLSGDTHVAIATVPAAVVAIDPDLADRPFADRHIAITMTDVLGDPLEGTVSWQMYGPAGVAVPDPGAGLPTVRGAVVLPIADLGTPGPEGMRVRAPWATTTLPLLTAFDLSKSTTLDLGGGVLGGNPSCAIRGHGAGQPLTAVCLAGSTLGQHRNVAELAWSGAAWTVTPHLVPASVQNISGLFVDRDGSANEPVYLVGADAAGNGTWYRLGDAAASSSPQFTGPIQKLIYVPKCTGAASALVAVSAGLATAVSAVKFFTPDGGGNVAAPNLTNLSSGGCVSDVDGSIHQGVVATQVSGSNVGDPALFVLTGANMQSQAIAIKKNAGTGFIATEGGEQRFVGTRLEAEGTVVFEAVLTKAGASFDLVERAELAAAAPPSSIISGKIDADSGYDLIWDIGATATRKLFQMSLSKQVLGAPLTAITSGPAAVGITDAVGFVVGDLNAKGVDEVVLFTANAATIYSPDQ